MAQQPLSPVQAHALLDFLSHRETYDEIEKFKLPGTLETYGPPFHVNEDDSSTSPLLQALLSKFVVKLPGLRDVSTDFWQVRTKSIIEGLAAAELSESYDKGGMGIRKTLTTAISAFVEYVGRGAFGGYKKQSMDRPDGQYGTGKAEEVEKAWHDFLQQMVYGKLLDDVFKKAGETDRLEEHDPIIKATHEYVVINLASILHYTLVVHPKGQPLLVLIDKLNRQIPYGLVKQTLKVGNVATMINGMMKIFLVKLSINSWSNWAGISQGADEGMNLLQQIISTVLGWDIKDLKSRAIKIEKDKEGPSKEQLDAMKSYLQKSRQDHEDVRSRSQKESKSIAAIILSDSKVSQEVSEKQHQQLLEYLAVILAVQDREKIIRVLCKSNPDHLTQLIKDIVKAYEPVIRQVHSAVDLSATTADFEAFVDEMIKLAKIDDKSKKKKGGVGEQQEPPSVHDFVQLLKRHQSSSHRFIHQVVKNGPEVTQWWLDYAKHVASQFREPAEGLNGPENEKVDDRQDAGALEAFLTTMFLNLNEGDQKSVLKEVDEYAAYLSKINKASSARLKSVMSNNSSTDSYGPGMYLTKWQDLLDSTPVTPAQMRGKVRHGNDESVIESTATGVEGEQTADLKVAEAITSKSAGEKGIRPGDMTKTWTLLGASFRENLAQQSKSW